MTEQDIRKATQAFERLLRRNQDCKFGRIETVIQKGLIKDMVLHREDSAMRNGEPVEDAGD